MAGAAAAAALLVGPGLAAVPAQAAASPATIGSETHGDYAGHDLELRNSGDSDSSDSSDRGDPDSAETAGGGGSLPRIGVATGAVVAGGLLLLAAGAIMVFLTRREHRG